MLSVEREREGPLLKEHSVDAVLMVALFALLGLGCVLVFSASAVFATRQYGSASYFLERHVLWAALGLGAMAFGARLDFVVWRKTAPPLLLISVALLGLCLVPGIGARFNGANRWLRLGSITFQPSELAKFALVAYLAAVLARRLAPDGVRQMEEVATRPQGLFPPMLIAGLLVLLVLLEPDLGTAMLLAGTALAMFFAAGARTSYLAIGILVAMPIVYQKLIVEKPWRLGRVLAFLDPLAHRQDIGYQISESLISVGSGGLWGVGLGQGNQKLFFLPEAHTDFILAVLGEELGLVGITLVICCFGVVLWRGMRAALRARDLFGTYLGFGITAGLLMGALAHMGVVLGLLPTKGTTLPLVSYGGSSLTLTLFACGVLLNISTGRAEPTQVRVERGEHDGNRRITPRASRFTPQVQTPAVQARAERG